MFLGNVRKRKKGEESRKAGYFISPRGRTGDRSQKQETGELTCLVSRQCFCHVRDTLWTLCNLHNSTTCCALTHCTTRHGEKCF